MSLFDFFVGWQNWADYVNNRDLATLFEKSLADAGDRLSIQIPRAERDTALVEGLGSIENLLTSGFENLSLGLECVSFDLQGVSAGIDGLRADFHILMGDVIWRQEMQTAALKDILRTLQAPLDTASRELRARGEDAYRNGWYQEALSDFLESEQKNYQDFAVHRFIGNIYLYHIVDLPRASEYFRKAAKYARPRDCKQAAEAEFFAGIAFGLQKVYDAALKHMLEVVSLNATFYEAHYMAASFAALLGDAPAACEFAQKAIRGDIRYYERFKHDRCFDKMRSELGMLEELKAQERLTDSLVATFESTLEHLRYQCQDVRSLWAAGAAPYDLSCQLEEVKKLRRQADYVALRVAASKICEALSLPPSCAVPALHQETESTWNSQTQSPKVLAQRLIESWTLGRIGPSHNMPR